MPYLRFMVFAILFMCLWSDSAVACQESVEGQDVNSSRAVQAEGIIITWSEKNDELRGFSQKLGEWEVLKIDPQKLNPQQKITPVVDSNIAAVRFGDSIAAFSGEQGWWDVVELSKNSTAVPVVSPSLAVFEDNGHLYTFSASKGRWTSPTDPELQPATFEHSFRPREVESGGRKFDEWLTQLPEYEARRIRVSPYSGINEIRTTYMTTRQSTMKLVRQKIEEFWCPKKPVATEATPLPDQKRSSAEIDSQIAKFREDLDKLESTVQAGSGQLNNPTVDQDQQSRELRKLVEQSFDLRQQLQELEAQRLRLKLQQVENNLAVRAKSRDAMVERRMEELRRPNSGNKIPPQEPDNRSTSRDKAPDLYLAEPIQQMQPLTTFVDDDSARISNGRGTWNEVLDVIKLLEEKKKSYEPLQTAVQSFQQKQQRFARPFSDWTAEERQEFENTLKALLQEKPANTELAADLDAVLVEYRNVYIRLGIMKADSEEVQPELSAETRERLRTDLVNHQVSQKEVYSEKIANVVREWTTVWSLYVARRRELELSVERGEERLGEMDRQAEKILVGDKQTAKSVESQKRQAQLIVEQLRARLQPFLNLEKDHPELKPPTLAESKSPSTTEEDAAPILSGKGQERLAQPGEIARQLRSLRESAISDMEAIRIKKGSVETWSLPLEKLIADGRLKAGSGEDERRAVLANAEGKAKELEINLNGSRRDWSHAWSAYQAQLELFQLDMNDRKQEETLVALEVKQRTDANRESPNAYSPGEIRESEIKHEKSKIAVQRAEQMLKLYADVETNEPELNPATLKGLDEVTASKEVTASVPSEPGQNLPQQVISMAEQLRKLREAAVKIREERQPHENLITQYSRPLEQLKAEGVVSEETTEEDLKTQIARSKPEFDRLTRELDTATKAWKQVWSAYQSQSRLLELEVKHAENSLVSAEQTLEHTRAKSDQGLVGSQEVRDTEARLSAAVVQHEKAREMLHLWQELEKNEPEMNPDWKPAETLKP